MPRPGTEVVFDPATYAGGVPLRVLARLRRTSPVVWVEEVRVLGWPGGPGFWLVLRHADVVPVLSRPQLFSSALGATQMPEYDFSANGHALGARPPLVSQVSRSSTSSGAGRRRPGRGRVGRASA